MSDDAARDIALKVELAREDYDDKYMCQFLLFLKRKNGLIVEEDEMQEIEWNVAVKKAKRKSASSTF